MTDSTWSLSPTLADTFGIAVLPLHISAGSAAFLDRPEERDRIIDLLRSRSLTTSQPTPGEVRELLWAVAARADAIVCIHLSARLSGTVGLVRTVGAEVAAERDIQIEVVDSGTVGGALGYSVAVAAATIAGGSSLDAAAAEARDCAATSGVFLVVNDLRHLQRGGRLRAPQLAIGSALGIKPILGVQEGEIRLLESVRGTARAYGRVVDLALRAAHGAAGDRARLPVSFAVHHVDNAETAERLADQLAAAAAAADLTLDRLDVTPMAGVLAVHAGPGAVAVAIAHTRGLLHS